VVKQSGRDENEERKLDNILLILASLNFCKKPIKGRTRLQKMIFLLKEENGIPFDFEFRPYFYGPYSEQLSDFVHLLNALNLVEEETEYLGTGIVRYNYILTEKGKEYYMMFKEKAEKESEDVIEKLEKGVKAVCKLPTPELISKSKSIMRS
jgi:uncharacterized protein YwgA